MEYLIVFYRFRTMTHGNLWQTTKSSINASQRLSWNAVKFHCRFENEVKAYHVDWHAEDWWKAKQKHFFEHTIKMWPKCLYIFWSMELYMNEIGLSRYSIFIWPTPLEIINGRSNIAGGSVHSRMKPCWQRAHARCSYILIEIERGRDSMRIDIWAFMLWSSSRHICAV